MSNFDVAPHGIIGFALFALILVWALHATGFRVVGALKVGR